MRADIAAQESINPMNLPLNRLDNPENPLAPKTVDASCITLSQVIFPKDTNELHLATAGVILKSIDVAASLTAGKHCAKKVVTASLDRMDFVNPAHLWELVSTHCRMTKTWTSSMEVMVVVDAENTRNGEKRRVAIGYLVFVALDDVTFKPAPVPPLLLQTEDEVRLAEEAEMRKITRIAEQKHLGDRVLTEIDDSDAAESVTRTMTPDDSNIHHNVFGGTILEMIHQAGEKAAIHQTNGPVISVRQDRMSFEQPAYIGEEVKAQAVITRTWNTSMEIQADVIARDYKTGEQRKVASSYLVYVAQDPEGHPKPVPMFEPKTPKQVLRWDEAEIRRGIRLRERLSAQSE